MPMIPTEDESATIKPILLDVASLSEDMLPAWLMNNPALLDLIASKTNTWALSLIQEWEEVVKPDPTQRQRFDELMAHIINLQAVYFHLGGSGCITDFATGQECKKEWTPVPLCWSCVGGEGKPQLPEDFLSGPDFAAILSTLEKIQGTADILLDVIDPCLHGSLTPLPEATKSLLGFSHVCEDCERWLKVEDGINTATPPEAEHDLKWSTKTGIAPFTSCSRSGCEADIVHVHISSVGHCRREVAYGLLGYEESNPGRPHWKRAAELSSHSEGIMVNALMERGFMIADAVDDQVDVHFFSEATGILYIGHPDGDIVGRNEEVWPSPANLELKCPRDQYFMAIKDQGVQNVRPAYYAQMHGYMTAKGQDKSYLAIMSRDQGLMSIETIDYDPAYWATMDKRWGDVRSDIVSEVLPKPDHSGSGYECLVCSFHDLCPAWIAAKGEKS